MSIYSLKVKDITGAEVDMAQYKGHVRLPLDSRASTTLKLTA